MTGASTAIVSYRSLAAPFGHQRAVMVEDHVLQRAQNVLVLHGTLHQATSRPAACRAICRSNQCVHSILHDCEVSVLCI